MFTFEYMGSSNKKNAMDDCSSIKQRTSKFTSNFCIEKFLDQETHTNNDDHLVINVERCTSTESLPSSGTTKTQENDDSTSDNPSFSVRKNLFYFILFYKVFIYIYTHACFMFIEIIMFHIKLL